MHIYDIHTHFLAQLALLFIRPTLQAHYGLYWVPRKLRNYKFRILQAR